MLNTPPRVVLDANVLFPFTIRDTLLRAAMAGLCQIYWSREILDEATRNLIATGRMSEEQVAHLISAMSKAFPEALIEDYEPFIPLMSNDEKDRHVAAAAFKAEAHLIITNNLKDFKPLPEGINAQSVDEFLVHLLEAQPLEMMSLLEKQAAALRRPPVTLRELLTGISKTAPCFARMAQERCLERFTDEH